MSIKIEFTLKAEKQFKKAPKQVQASAAKWIASVYEIGLEATNKQGGKGLHAEPLKGEMKGIWSIRLNKAWRLYYSVKKGVVEVVLVSGIDKHKYGG